MWRAKCVSYSEMKYSPREYRVMCALGRLRRTDLRFAITRRPLVVQKHICSLQLNYLKGTGRQLYA